MGSYIAHIDADCFYVSAERVRNPSLRKKPVAVLGNQGACVIAKSYEMKAHGVKTGEPIWEARKKCPSGIYAKRDFEWYGVLSRKMLATLSSFSPTIEYYSIDEFFVHVKAPAKSLDRLALDMRDAVGEAVGVPVTVGIARTRTLAKLFSDTAKPHGARAAVTRDAEEELLSKLAVTEVTGIGSKRAARVEPYGVRTALDLAQADGRMVRNRLTVTGWEIWAELNGEKVHPLRPSRAPKQVISRGGSTKGDVDDPHTLFAWLVRNLERLIEELNFEAVRTGKVSVYLVYRNGTSSGGEAPLDAATDRFDLLLDAARVALRRAYCDHSPVTHLHLIADHLRRGGQQLTLFDAMLDPKVAAVAEVKRAVNDKIGRFALRSGSTLPLSRIYRDPAENFDVPDIKGKHCF